MSTRDDLLKPVVAGQARILTIDIERLPGLAPVWDQKTRYIPASQWVRYPRMVCFAAEWYGATTPLFHASWHKTDMVKAAWDLYDRADVVVTFNGVRFDNTHLRTEWLLAGLPPPSPWKDVDLFQVAARTFGFDSKSLAHLCERLDLPGKTGHYDSKVAEAAAAGDKTAQTELRSYNLGDIAANWAVYDRLRPWIHNHPHINVTDKPTCNKCGSTDLNRIGDYRAIVLDYAAYRCADCGGLIRAGHTRRAATTRGIR